MAYADREEFLVEEDIEFVEFSRPADDDPVLDSVKLRTGHRGGLTRHAPWPVRSVAAVVRGRSDAAARNPNG